jgi:hypothetical protein
VQAEVEAMASEAQTRRCATTDMQDSAEAQARVVGLQSRSPRSIRVTRHLLDCGPEGIPEGSPAAAAAIASVQDSHRC